MTRYTSNENAQTEVVFDFGLGIVFFEERTV